MPLHAELLCASFGVWSVLARSRFAWDAQGSAAADAPIVWIGGAPTDEEAHVVWDAVACRGITRYAAVVADVAERLFRRDLTRIGVALDIGFFQPFYRRYTRELLGRLEGTMLRIGQTR